MTLTDFLIFGLISVVVYIALDTLMLLNKNRSHKKRAEPSLLEIIKHYRFDLKIDSSGKMPRRKIDEAMALGGRAAVEAAIYEHFKPCRKHDDWSIGYRYPCVAFDGSRHAGFWERQPRHDEASVFFYDYVTPPAPSVEPKPPVVSAQLWTDEDERRRIEMYLAGPSAFWLNPDWSDPSEPFWMRDPAPIPAAFLPEDIDYKLKQIIAMVDPNWPWLTQRLEHREIGAGPYKMFLYDSGGNEMIVSSRDYNRAMRIAMKMTPTQREHLVEKYYDERLDRLGRIALGDTHAKH